jgi:outer membrane protein TolC
MLHAYDEMIAAADAVDREAAYADLLQAHNDLTDVIWAYLQAGNTAVALVLEEEQKQLKEQLDTYKPENYSKTYAALVLPIRALSDQLILDVESLYLSIAALDLNIERGRIELAKLDRTVQDTRLLSSFGRVSVFACAEAEAARDAASHQLDALIGQSQKWKAALQILIGETSTGVLTLAPVPEVTQLQLSSLQYDADLKAGLESNCDLCLMENEISDAKEAWEDADNSYQEKAAEHSYNAAVYTYKAGKQDFQQSFDTVYRSVADAQSDVEAAQKAAAHQQKAYAAAQLRYGLGMISKSALLTAEADLAIAKLAVQTANIALASAYNNYCWARRGLLTAQT